MTNVKYFTLISFAIASINMKRPTKNLTNEQWKDLSCLVKETGFVKISNTESDDMFSGLEILNTGENKFKLQKTKLEQQRIIVRDQNWKITDKERGTLRCGTFMDLTENKIKSIHNHFIRLNDENILSTNIGWDIENLKDCLRIFACNSSCNLLEVKNLLCSFLTDIISDHFKVRGIKHDKICNAVDIIVNECITNIDEGDTFNRKSFYHYKAQDSSFDVDQFLKNNGYNLIEKTNTTNIGNTTFTDIKNNVTPDNKQGKNNFCYLS